MKTKTNPQFSPPFLSDRNAGSQRTHYGKRNKIFQDRRKFDKAHTNTTVFPFKQGNSVLQSE